MWVASSMWGCIFAVGCFFDVGKHPPRASLAFVAEARACSANVSNLVRASDPGLSSPGAVDRPGCLALSIEGGDNGSHAEALDGPYASATLTSPTTNLRPKFMDPPRSSERRCGDGPLSQCVLFRHRGADVASACKRVTFSLRPAINSQRRSTSRGTTG